MTVPRYLACRHVIYIHNYQIKRYGGSNGIRDYGLLEAAISRPQSGYYQDTISQAAAFWESLAQNHPFVDGNKRTAFASTDAFLRVNGIHILANEHSAFNFIINLYEMRSFRSESLEDWLRDNI